MVMNPEKNNKKKNIWKINWKQYNTFYRGTRRKSSRKRKYCKKTNMVEQAIGIIEGTPYTGGKKTKKKKT
jgi:hypothetical protein